VDSVLVGMEGQVQGGPDANPRIPSTAEKGNQGDLSTIMLLE